MIRRSGVFGTRIRSRGGRGPTGGRFDYRGRGRGRVGYNFAIQGRGKQTEREVPPEDVVLVAGVDGVAIPMRCWNCNDWGHGSNNYPKPRQGRSGTSSV